MNKKNLLHLLAISIILVTLIASVPVFASARSLNSLASNTQFYVPKPNHGAVEQIAALTSDGNKADAKLIKQMIGTPQAVWFTQGTPKTVMQGVRNTVQRAADKGQVPVLVAYNIPFRDCAQYSAGGATTVDEYEAWIDGFAAGIGNYNAVVLLEPDGLGIIPWYTNRDGALEWCQPGEANAATASAERFEMLNYAVDALKAKPNISVYLDGTHSGWLRIDENADRLVKAGVARADGFFLNVSNYQFTVNSAVYGNWVSSCIAYATTVSPGDFGACPNQYWNGGPLPSKIAQLFGEWNGVAMSPYGVWSDDSLVQSLNPSGINLRYANMLGSVVPATHFVIDTSRNGQGPWLAPADHPAGDPQDWCNPPDRGLGLRPTANTGKPLVDAYLWIKIPGESDGQCYRWTSGPLDPVRNMMDPAAGAWFSEMALELVHNANPPLP
jgi:endoglucanase